ncbi:hypothetical protein AMC99_00622 [Altererythrobacter epoxidivorans]|uniref:Uncharacterized protein n=1 Tax=Altererythrobacter epoxidivorans TaxID=361183 RepID=A0A0M3T9U8_9SPHN|nr:hypothetical protein AMC99_00622 [Altererythrobacter epoxidivorans]
MNVCDTSRPKLSMRYGAIHAQSGGRDNKNAGTMATAELRRVVATMID